ncbi:Uncharacterised protein [Vibrio cholerae]|nr:Uncharacterised protein [Vibrio cholerae]
MKISICLTNRNAAPKAKSRLKRVLSHWPIRCGRSLILTLKAKRQNTLMPRKASPTAKPHWMAHALS